MIYVLKKSEYSVTLADTETFQSKDYYSGDLVEFLNNGGSIVNLNMFKPLGDSQISRFVLHYAGFTTGLLRTHRTNLQLLKRADIIICCLRVMFICFHVFLCKVSYTIMG